MTFQLTLRRFAPFAAAALIAALYLADLSGMGLVSKDEPRYADIGRAMARTGDWITPHLWGQPWFEKPPLLYWLTGLGFKAGLGPETAPRLPVALLSLGFLTFFWLRVKRLWDQTVANYATAILATSAGWVALSHVAITDIPVAVFFNVAVLFFLSGAINWAAAALGIAVLAKSLPPLVFFLPLLALDLPSWRKWLRPAPILIFLAVAVPWHVIAYLRNGYEFFRVLFIEQQFGRFLTPERQHVQHWWFYLPVFLLFLFPWFPLLAAVPRAWGDRKARMLIVVVLFGLVFLSSALNKLPSYVLPLMPATAILLAVGIVRQPALSRSLITLAAVAVFALLGILPSAARVVPVALASRLSDAELPWKLLLFGVAVSALGGVAVVFLAKAKAIYLAFAISVIALLWFQAATFPEIDQRASVRPTWLSRHPTCAFTSERGALYGLYYYAGGPLPPCDILDQTPAPVVR